MTLTVGEARAIALDLLTTYCELVDHGDGDDAIAVFAGDCAVDYGTRRGVMRGWDELRPSLVSFHEHVAESSHHIFGCRVRLDGDEIDADSHVYAWQRLTTGEQLTIHGCYEDRLACGHDGWRIVRRRFRAYGTSRPQSAWKAPARADLAGH